MEECGGDFLAAHLLDQLRYWKPRASFGTIYKSYEELSIELCISRAQVFRGLKKLRELGLISTRLGWFAGKKVASITVEDRYEFIPIPRDNSYESAPILREDSYEFIATITESTKTESTKSKEVATVPVSDDPGGGSVTEAEDPDVKTVGDIAEKYDKMYSPESLASLSVSSQKGMFAAWSTVMKSLDRSGYLSGKSRGQLSKMLGLLRHEHHLSAQHIAQLLVRVCWSWEDFCVDCVQQGAWKPPDQPHVGFLLVNTELAVEKWLTYDAPSSEPVPVQPAAPKGAGGLALPEGLSFDE